MFVKKVNIKTFSSAFNTLHERYMEDVAELARAHEGDEAVFITAACDTIIGENQLEQGH